MLEAAVVVPAPNPVRLAVPKAYVAVAPGYNPGADTARDILRHARENLAPYLRVRRLEFAELPKTVPSPRPRAVTVDEVIREPATKPADQGRPGFGQLASRSAQDDGSHHAGTTRR
ncbi:hypothetical protein GCM10025762_44820 [Haloechinothrix salitolerans]